MIALEFCQIVVRDRMFVAILDWMAGKPAKICTTDLVRGTVEWANTMHDTTEICDMPSVYRLPLGGEFSEVVDVVDNLDYYALHSFRERKSFQELEAPCAFAAKERDVSKYDGFQGKYCPPSLAPIPDADPSLLDAGLLGDAKPIAK